MVLKSPSGFMYTPVAHLGSGPFIQVITSFTSSTWRITPLRIQLRPKKIWISPTILSWGWDLDHQCYSKEGLRRGLDSQGISPVTHFRVGAISRSICIQYLEDRSTEDQGLSKGVNIPPFITFLGYKSSIVQLSIQGQGHSQGSHFSHFSPHQNQPSFWEPSKTFQAHCNPEDFEIAASEFDAVTGTLLREKNVPQKGS